jgi:hypothetical protein
MLELRLDENASKVLHLPRDALKVATLHTCMFRKRLKNLFLHVELTLTGRMKMHERKFLMSKGKKGTKWKFIDPSGAMFTFMKLAQH